MSNWSNRLITTYTQRYSMYIKYAYVIRTIRDGQHISEMANRSVIFGHILNDTFFLLQTRSLYFKNCEYPFSHLLSRKLNDETLSMKKFYSIFVSNICESINVHTTAPYFHYLYI